MKEQFDRTLRNHIRDTFDHYDDQMADDGWRSFKKKERRRRRGLIFWYMLPSGMAAAIALLWLINLYPVASTDKNQQSTFKQSKANSNLGHKSGSVPFEKTEDIKTIASTKSNEENLAAHAPVHRGESENLSPELVKADHQQQVTQAKIPEIGIITSSKTFKVNDLSTWAQASNADFPELSINTLKPLFVSRAEHMDAKEKGIASYLPEKTLAFAKISNDFAAVEDHAKDPASSVPKKSKFNLSVDANTYVNFSESGLNDQVNLGLGLASEWKLTKHLSVNSGLMLNRQTSTFEGNEKSSSDFQKTILSSAFASVPSAQVTNAKLVGLDIPLNLKYSLKLGKANTFLSTGISSYSVINEKYVNDYSVVNYSFTGVRTSSVRTVQDNPAGKFSYFKFARTINFSFGVLYPLSKKSTLAVEPFLKYPLTGLGYQELRIGSGGLSFKLNFGN